MHVLPSWMCTPHELAAPPAPPEHRGSAPANAYEKLCVVPAVVIGPTEPDTLSAPPYV